MLGVAKTFFFLFFFNAITMCVCLVSIRTQLLTIYVCYGLCVFRSYYVLNNLMCAYILVMSCAFRAQSIAMQYGIESHVFFNKSYTNETTMFGFTSIRLRWLTCMLYFMKYVYDTRWAWGKILRVIIENN